MIEYIYTHANMYTIVYLQKDRSLGLDAEFYMFLLVKNMNIIFRHYIIWRLTNE